MQSLIIESFPLELETCEYHEPGTEIPTIDLLGECLTMLSSMVRTYLVMYITIVCASVFTNNQGLMMSIRDMKMSRKNLGYRKTQQMGERRASC